MSGVTDLGNGGVSLPAPPTFDNLEVGLRFVDFDKPLEGRGIEEIDLFPSKDSLGLAMLLIKFEFGAGEAELEGPLLVPNREEGLGIAEFSASGL